MTRSVYFSPSMRTLARPADFSADSVLQTFDSCEEFDAGIVATVVLAAEGARPVVRVQGGGPLPREIEVFRADHASSVSTLEGSNELSAWCAQRNPIVIRLSGDARSSGVLRIVHLFDPSENVRTDALRIEIEAGSSVSIVEEFVTPHLRTSMNAGTAVAATAAAFAARCEIHAGRGAQVSYALSIALAQGTDFSLVHFVRASRDANVQVASAFSGQAKSHVAWFTDCAEEGADVRFTGAARAGAGQTIDFINDTLHSASHTSSQTQYQTVLSDRAHTTFGGMIRIPKTSLGCDAVQKNQNLLLSQTAVAKAFPQLEIETDEVKCAHGATVSPVNEDQIYYMQARGISRGDAEAMIVAGATEPVVSRFPTEISQARAREVLS